MKFNQSYSMRKLLLSLLLSVNCAFAIDTYNSTNGQLFIPSVQVGNNVYSNVLITVGTVLGVGVNMTNASIHLYQSTFDISNYWVLGGTLRNCATNVSEMYFTSNNFNQGAQTNTVSTSHAVGTFNLPGGSTICSAINLSGVISHLDLTVNSTTVWTLDNAIVDASTLNVGWQAFWRDLYNKSITIVASSSTGGTLTCTNKYGGSLSTSLSPTPIDIKSWVGTCVN